MNHDGQPVAYLVVAGDTFASVAARFCIDSHYLDLLNQVRRVDSEVYAGDTINLDAYTITSVGRTAWSTPILLWAIFPLSVSGSTGRRADARQSLIERISPTGGIGLRRPVSDTGCQDPLRGIPRASAGGPALGRLVLNSGRLWRS